MTEKKRHGTTITAECTTCGSEFALTDPDSDAVFEAFKQWDDRHKHAEENP